MTVSSRFSLTLAAAALILTPMSNVEAHPATPTPPPLATRLSGEAAEAATAIDAFHAALKAGEPAKAAAFLEEDALVFEAGGAEHSKAEYADVHLAADVSFETSGESFISRRTGGSSGDLAWVASEGRTKSRRGDRVVDRLTTESVMLRRTSEGWRIVHIHWSSGPAPSVRVK